MTEAPPPDEAGLRASIRARSVGASTNRELDAVRKRLRRSEELYRAAAHGRVEAFFLYEAVRNGDGRIVDFIHIDVNDVGLADVSYTREQVIGASIQKLFPWVHAMGLFDRYVEVVETGVPFEGEISFEGLDLRVSWARIRAVAVGDGVAINALDVTQRKEAERALRASEEWHRRIVETADEGIWVLDSELTTTFANARTAELLRCEADELVGAPVAAVLTDEPSRVRLTALAARGWNPTSHVELKLSRSDGTTMLARLSASPILADDGTLEGGLVLVSDISEQKRLQEQLTHQSTHDPLTDLPNRNLIFDRLAMALARAQRSGHPVAVLFADLDHFKVLNDSLGHDKGDLALMTIAQRLEGSLRPADTVGRFGGDEYVIISEDLRGERDARRLAERLLEAVAGPIPSAGDWDPNMCMGVAISEPGDTPGVLISHADAAMFRAKEHGPGRYELFHPALRDKAAARFDTETELRRALKRDELNVLFQPQVSIDSGGLVGAEALVRWQHPDRGLVAPVEFLPVAEATGLIVDLGEQVLARACEEAARWQQLSRRPVSVSVNLSARQLAEPRIVDRAASILLATGLPPELLCLEITESVVMADVALSLTALNALRALGLQLSIDDFGTGYSSLANLKQTVVDELKIDRTFVDGLGNDPQDTAIAEATIALAHVLGLRATAEGVESEDQLEELRRLGCDRAQGYLFAEPLTGQVFETDWLRRPH